MPNWTSNAVTITGDKKKLVIFKNKVAGENGSVDFNSLVPMPAGLHIESGSNTGLGMACFDEAHFKEWSSFSWFPERYPNVTTPEQLYLILQEKAPEVVELGKQAIANIKSYGYPTWYEWAYVNWGTKWNACEIELEESDDRLDYRFDTAWDAPRPLIEPIQQLAHEHGLSIVWHCDHEDGSCEGLVDDDRQVRAA